MTAIRTTPRLLLSEDERRGRASETARYRAEFMKSEAGR